LFGCLLTATGFKRWDGCLLLVVVLQDGSPGPMRADLSDVLGDAAAGEVSVSVEGVRRLRLLATHSSHADGPGNGLEHK
jgi:hypothetical protein